MASPEPEITVADAAHGSMGATVEAIDEAARLNSDPAVAEALDEASIRAETTVGRLEWLRARLRRIFSR